MGVKVMKKGSAATSEATATKVTKVPDMEDMEDEFLNESDVIGEVHSEYDHLAEVEVGMGLTINLGNYESLRLNVNVKLPCEPTPEDIEATYQSAKEWVDAKLIALKEEITS